jgi:hypothetical protein
MARVNVTKFIEGYVMRGRSRTHGTIRKQIPLIGRQFRTASEHRNQELSSHFGHDEREVVVINSVDYFMLYL